MASKQRHYQADIIVVGAGLVGLSAIIALAGTGKRVVLVDAKSQPNIEKLNQAYDTRVYAITPSTVRWLKELGVWSYLDQARVNPVQDMLLWHPESDAPMTLSAEDARLSDLGCIVENQNLMRSLWCRLDALNVELKLGQQCDVIDRNEEAVVMRLADGQSISASLVVAADGVQSFVRKQAGIATHDKDFNQTALVANFTVQSPHHAAARQWFAPHDTLALLPLPDKQVSMVWSVSTKVAAELLLLDTDTLTERVEAKAQCAGLGRFTMVSDMQSFPLKQVTVTKLVSDRVALIGDAAHQVHPMAGQGANLGFRDVMMLEDMLTRTHRLSDIGEESFLRTYERNRKADVLSMNTLTSGLDQLFASQSTMLQKMTGLGMDYLDKQTFLKQLLIKQAVA
jgi:2-octaprenylphenol hydroxylase